MAIPSYLFDCGVQRGLAGLQRDKPASAERGVLFETWVLNELRALTPGGATAPDSPIGGPKPERK